MAKPKTVPAPAPAPAPALVVDQVIAERAKKWGFGNNVDAYLKSRDLQSQARKLRAAGDAKWKVVHEQFRELNRDKKRKYGEAV